ncbi:MAG: type II toxin-antitoxin system VapC family toxin [Thermoleophilia bacterium]|nr:type II toxin-antitoxin system VapC family toxin [Thermoleophilia bacterium]
MSNAAAFIDTSAIIALYNDDDRVHAEAARWLRAWDDRPLVTHLAVVTEATALLDRRLGVEVTTRFTEQLLPTIAVFVGNEPLYDRAATAYRAQRGRRRPSLTDRLAFETMLELEIATAFAFDQHFLDAGFTRD